MPTITSASTWLGFPFWSFHSQAHQSVTQGAQSVRWVLYDSRLGVLDVKSHFTD